jgi:tRNA (mo5U34)-methyltransferase
MKRRLSRHRLKQVDHDDVGVPLHLAEEGEGVVDMLDHVECVRRVEASRNLAIEVVDLGVEPAPLEAPAQIRGAGVVEVRELDAIAGLKEHQPIGADAAAVVQDARAPRDEAGELAEIRQLCARHRERGQVVQVGVGGAVEALLVAAGLELILKRALVLLESKTVVPLTEIETELVLLALGIRAQGNVVRHDRRRYPSRGATLPPPVPEVQIQPSLRDEVASRQWYHTLELEPGLETPGWFDLRGLVDQVPIPRTLTGQRCLDVGTFDGFWAFELERRGAQEVIAIDILDPRKFDWPAGSEEEVMKIIGERKGHGEGFEIAREALGSSVTRLELSTYDLDPEDVGQFDFVYVGSLLLHLRDPIGALERVRSVCSGTLLVIDAIDLPLSMLLRRKPVAGLDGRGRPWWWKPNLSGLARMVEAAGFALTESPRRVFMKPGRGHPPLRLRPRWLLHSAGREEMFRAWRGDPHGVVAAKPAA